MARARGQRAAQSTARSPVIALDPPNEEARELWRAVLSLVVELPPTDWTLVGGLMVQLHAYRHGEANVRLTDDIDLLGDSRVRPESLTEVISRTLVALGYKGALPSGLDSQGTDYRFRQGNRVVDVLGPDGLKHGATTLGKSETIQVKGGTQALRRSETVVIELEGQSATLRCPNLLGAILLKARAMKTRDQDEDRRDLAVLLSCVEDPIAMRAELVGREAQWLRAAAKTLDLDDPNLRYTMSAAQRTRARQAFELLVAS